jgi:hypothetical protein
MPSCSRVPVEERVDVVHADGKGICLGHDEFDQVQIVGRSVVIPPPVPVIACSLDGGKDRLDLNRGALSTGQGASEMATASSQRKTFSPLC